jgi:hypothetical protein
LFYFRQNLNLSSPMWTLGIIGAVAIVVIFLSLLKKHEQPAAKVEASRSM